METNYIEEWDENTPIDWWNAGRKKLNKVIKKYNKWQRRGFKYHKGKKLQNKLKNICIGKIL